jgi:hypothetical protein
MIDSIKRKREFEQMGIISRACNAHSSLFSFIFL